MLNLGTQLLNSKPVVIAHVLEWMFKRGFPYTSLLAGSFRIFRKSLVSADLARFDSKFALEESGKVVVGVWEEQKGYVLEQALSRRALYARAYSDALVSANRRGGFIVLKESIITPIVEFSGPSKISFPGHETGGILRQQEDSVWWRKPKSVRIIESGIFCGTLAPHNWYHWIVDSLPTIRLATMLPKQFSNYPLLVPQVVKDRDNWIESLSLVAGGRRIEWVDEEAFYKVGRLVSIDNATGGFPRPLVGPGANRIWFHETALKDFVRDIRKAVIDKGSSRPTAPKIFIARSQQAVRRYNQEEVFSIAKKFGYQRVFLEELTFAESVQLFAGASSVVGPHGAGWANLLFANTNLKGLLWTWRDFRGDNWYENVVLASGSKVRVWFQASPGSIDVRMADYKVDLDQFENKLQQIEEEC